MSQLQRPSILRDGPHKNSPGSDHQIPRRGERVKKRGVDSLSSVGNDHGVQAFSGTGRYLVPAEDLAHESHGGAHVNRAHIRRRPGFDIPPREPFHELGNRRYSDSS